ncbi:MAG: ribonuclease III [Myxococcales bacterium]|nr:ribonuclease III [Myxococcales bacterium]USN50883.1 MAG: ribonuclease III [Myxococcales bacterium]
MPIFDLNQKSTQYQVLDRAIAYKFKDHSLLKLALMHKSARVKNNPSDQLINNERLEFLGDAVLSVITADFLYQNKKHLREGDLSRLRAQYVCQENLALGAQRIKLGDYLVSDRAMRAAGGNYTAAVLADALEAIFGAVYIDGGLDSARVTIFSVLGEPSLDLSTIEKDAKTRLQEIVQAHIHQAPKYIILDKSGPAHAPTFHVGIKVQDKIVASAHGENLKIATQNAAMIALSDYELASR